MHSYRAVTGVDLSVHADAIDARATGATCRPPCTCSRRLEERRRRSPALAARAPSAGARPVDEHGCRARLGA